MIQSEQIETIKKLREQNYTYASIGKALDMSGNTVKSVCRKYGFMPDPDMPQKNINHVPTIEELPRCKYCGRTMENPWNRKGKAFCSDKCRFSWWNRERQVLGYIAAERPKDLSQRTLDFNGQKRD